jgi:aspartate kinase
MALIVQKYGGTSVGSVERIQSVAKKLVKFHKEGHQIIVVVSAMSGETNRLVSLANAISVEPSAREYDVLVSTGEQVTISLLSMAIHELGVDAISFTGPQVKILTDEVHSKARIRKISDVKIRKALNDKKIVVVAGFQGSDEAGNITTLGRGGSDTSAVALAAALKADECQIYTDVDGVYTTDPRVVTDARRLEKITFEEMLEMASLGSKILQIRSVEFAGKYKVPLRVLSSFEDGEGTLITTEENEVEQALISGIAFSKDEAQLTIKGVPDQPGIAAKILKTIAQENIDVDMIVQNVGVDGATDFTFTVHRNDFAKAKNIIKNKAGELKAARFDSNENIVKVSMVGVGMRSHAGIAAQMFDVLAQEGINILMISTSEIKISVVVDEKYLELAVRALHSAFELEKKPD